MTPIKGKCDPYFETGTEGVIWSVYEDGKEGYDGLHCLNEGDYLTIFDPADSTKVVWEGNIDLEYERNYLPFPMNPEYGQQAIMGMWVHGIQRNVEPDDWGTWFFKAYPAEVIKSEIGRLFRCKSSTIEGHLWSGKGSPYNSIKDTGDLIIKFKNGGYYRYKDVDADTFWEFESAESKGKYHARNIKNVFVVEKIDLPKPARYSTNKPKPWKKYPADHGSDVPGAWPFPTGPKPHEGPREETFDEFLEWTEEEEEEFLNIMDNQKDNEL